MGRDLGPVTGVPPGKDRGPVEVLWDGDGVPPRKDMETVEVLWDGDEVNPPPPRVVYRQTPVKTVLSRHTAYTSGNNENDTTVWRIQSSQQIGC